MLRLIKELTANDLGLTGSHQAGFHVPKALAQNLPQLDETALNPAALIQVSDPAGSSDMWRFIHYNNRVVQDGTRNEYRVTRTARLLRTLGAGPGDALVIEFGTPRATEWRVELLTGYQASPGDVDVGVLRLDRSGWKSPRTP